MTFAAALLELTFASEQDAVTNPVFSYRSRRRPSVSLGGGGSALDPFLRQSSILIFDEFANPLHERRAFRDYVTAFGRSGRGSWVRLANTTRR